MASTITMKAGCAKKSFFKLVDLWAAYGTTEWYQRAIKLVQRAIKHVQNYLARYHRWNVALQDTRNA